MQLVPFLAVASIVVVTPGVDMALVTRNALMHGRRAALMTALGINLGILFWVVAAALGLAAVIATSATAFAAVRLCGAAYLIYLGIQALRSLRGRNVLARPRVKRALDRITGLVLIGLGVRLALEHRA